MLFETQLPLTPDAPTIYRYSTSRGVIFEQHVHPSGVRSWWKETK